MLLGVVANTGETGPPIWCEGGLAPFMFQQDSAPTHEAWKTINFVWGPQMRPPNSPDNLAPLDYGILSLILSEACKTLAGSVLASRKPHLEERQASQNPLNLQKKLLLFGKMYCPRAIILLLIIYIF